jgi:hypothetical protein
MVKKTPVPTRQKLSLQRVEKGYQAEIGYICNAAASIFFPNKLRTTKTWNSEDITHMQKAN